jgi:hypothetical protein
VRNYWRRGLGRGWIDVHIRYGGTFGSISQRAWEKGGGKRLVDRIDRQGGRYYVNGW